ncbi:hypothetical protein BC830DRAFT_888052 [Chytriomyces sp. MP71]|nr:hypothetical protein BC830DRAFT_888052 [Chytriomyces sp. MP71]
MPIQSLPPWLSLPGAYLLVPFVHFHLLRSRLSRSAATLATLSLLSTLPLLFPCSDPLMDALVRASLCSYLVCRALEALCQPRRATSQWSRAHYLEFLVTADNPALRSHRRRASAPLPSRGRRARKWAHKHVPAEAQDPAFFASMARQACMHYALFAGARAYFERHQYTYEPWFLSLWDLDAVTSHFMFGLMLYSQMSLTSLWRLPFLIYCKYPHLPSFDAPYAACSLVDFWSNRWNSRIQLSLHKIVFTPIMKWLDSSRSDSKTKSKARTPTHLAIASCLTFLASGLYHEYCVFMFMPGELPGPTGLFFVLNGAACLVQVTFQRYTGYGTTWGTGRFWEFIGCPPMWRKLDNSCSLHPAFHMPQQLRHHSCPYPGYMTCLSHPLQHALIQQVLEPSLLHGQHAVHALANVLQQPSILGHAVDSMGGRHNISEQLVAVATTEVDVSWCSASSAKR